MDDLSEPFSKFRNTCPSASLILASPMLTRPFAAGGLTSSKGSSMTFLAFHPHHMMLGCASSDGLRPGSSTEHVGHINLFRMQDYSKTLNSVSTTLSYSAYF